MLPVESFIIRLDLAGWLKSTFPCGKPQSAFSSLTFESEIWLELFCDMIEQKG